MSMISEIIICKGIKLDKSHINVLNYSESDMVSLCRQKQIASADDYSFIRKKGTINTNFTYSQCLQCNYMAFQNKDYSNKWFFAFIDDVKYVSNENTEISYTIDSFATWWDYWTSKKCFINRQHVLNDSIGINTVPENIDVGEVFCEHATEDSSLSAYYYVGFFSSFNPAENNNQGQSYAKITCFNKNIFAKQLFLFKADSSTDIRNIQLFIYHTNKLGHINDIQDMFIIPDFFINASDLIQYNGTVEIDSTNYNYSFWGLQNNFNVSSFNTTISKRHSFSDYTPKNNKLFCYPYNYLIATNNIGSINLYKYEDFYSENCIFRNEGILSVGASIQAVPLAYKGNIRNDDEAISVAKYPTLSWGSDSFTNWLTQNAVNFQTGILGTVLNTAVAGLGMVAGAGAGAGAGASASEMSTSNLASTGGNFITGAFSQYTSMLNQFYKASLLPENTKGTNTGDINFFAERNCITFKEMRAKTEYLKIIDSFFDRFGYKISKIDTPHFSGRRNWNYVEIGSNECIGYGEVPSSYMEVINNTFRKGVTIWHNHDNIGDYSLDNSIIS